ncbi:galactose-1-epimerase [Streptacidiphilus pinicola]|uniref:Aldose 1-epimerase n=1 Tax=Streptacidiphilus pinicola TaxID=2219663 RepID=A0A2X0IDE3_9ACTN|nr:aldose epimerase family protein [Streptacidiphilus pinicola]RAG81431.1 galactose-1-epimerase [Streptacidiphilus pinicola]
MPQPRLTRAPFGTLPDGAPVARWTLDSGSGVRAEVLEYGGVLHRLEVPDRSGRAETVVLGLADLAAYRADTAYLGALVGRYANRLAHGRFTLDGRTHQVPVNDRGHALHGGPDGFHRRLWRAVPLPGPTAGLRLSLRSRDGDMGFPGTLDVTADYTLDRHGTLRLELTARTDRATPVNLTYHAYFHLGLDGGGRGDVLAHRLAVDADAYLPVDAEAIPLGVPAPTAGTPFDFRTPHELGERIDEVHPQLVAAGGYDHCFVLPPARVGVLRRAARLHEPGSGRRMEVWTTEPGLQVYTGNALDGSLRGPDGKRHERHAALCLETQQFPDAPNRPDFPDPVLRPGAVRRSTTEFRFPHLSGTAPEDGRGQA